MNNRIRQRSSALATAKKSSNDAHLNFDAIEYTSALETAINSSRDAHLNGDAIEYYDEHIDQLCPYDLHDDLIDQLDPNDLHHDGEATEHVNGDATKVIHHIDEIDCDGRDFVTWSRESDRSQADHLPAQKANLDSEIEKRGGNVVKRFSRIGPAREMRGLAKAAAYVKAHNAILISESTCRYMRPELFCARDSVCKHYQSTEEDLERLRKETAGCQLVTILHPNTPLKDCLKYQSKRGKKFSKKKDGRPKKKPKPAPVCKSAIKKKYLLKVLKLNKQGKTIRPICKELGLKRSTVQRWITIAKNRGVPFLLRAR